MFSQLLIEMRQGDLSIKEATSIAIGMLYFLQDQIHDNENAKWESRFSIACSHIISELQQNPPIAFNDAKKAFIDFSERNKPFSDKHNKVLSSLDKYKGKEEKDVRLSQRNPF